jgi:hypothetical protein
LGCGALSPGILTSEIATAFNRRGLGPITARMSSRNDDVRICFGRVTVPSIATRTLTR